MFRIQSSLNMIFAALVIAVPHDGKFGSNQYEYSNEVKPCNNKSVCSWWNWRPCFYKDNTDDQSGHDSWNKDPTQTESEGTQPSHVPTDGETPGSESWTPSKPSEETTEQPTEQSWKPVTQQPTSEQPTEQTSEKPTTEQTTEKPVETESQPSRNTNESGSGSGSSGGASCTGKFYSDYDYVVALESSLFSGSCGRTVTIYANGRSVSATVVDECASGDGCLYNSIDATVGIWEALGIDTGRGIVDVTYSM
ncbi:hypothetical protein EDD86DRAFT_246916 [Gorgonomyces haynaldii]|nr:hypothetical protein EDD86DRAFT_246916 [Gorgonomyces haynaldii]